MTDRISKAVEHLGAEKTVKRHRKNANGAVLYEDGKDGKPDFKKAIISEETVPNIEVGIGGLLSLERIAQDSVKYDKGRDHVRVMEILTAYVRENAPASGAKSDTPRDLWEAAFEHAKEDLEPKNLNEPDQNRRATDMAVKACGISTIELSAQVINWISTLPPPRQDIAIALRIIGRRGEKQLLVEAAWPNAADAKTIWPFTNPCPALPDTPGEALLSANSMIAYRAKLEAWIKTIWEYSGYRPDLRDTNLQKADLASLTLSAAILSDARLDGADLTQVRLEGADGTCSPPARTDGRNGLNNRTDGRGNLIDGATDRSKPLAGADGRGKASRGADVGSKSGGARVWKRFISDMR